MRSGCVYCEQSVSFYRRLVDMQRTGLLHVAILAVLPDDETTSDNLLRIDGLSVPHVSRVHLPEIKVSRTPTLVLLDERGRVVETWIGLLSPGKENEVLTVIRHQTVRERNP